MDGKIGFGASAVVMDDGDVVVLSLCDRLSEREHEGTFVSECCAPCPSYTTVPCAC